MRRATIILLAIIILVVAGCRRNEDQPTATSEPGPQAEAPTTVATAELAEETPAATEIPSTEAPTGTVTGEFIPNPDLIDRTWAWETRVQSGRELDQIDVLNPEHFTLTFNEDGTFNAQVDCNRVSGSYTTSPPDSMTMMAGPSSLAACPPGSLADEMVKLFSEVQNFRFVENGNLLILPWADGTQDYFSLLDPQDIELPDPEQNIQAAIGTVTAPASQKMTGRKQYGRVSNPDCVS